jgi:ferritin-like metal-binding protein YciE
VAIFSKEYDSFESLFEGQLYDLYDAENRLLEALPKMAEAADSPDLKQAFSMHLGETEQHVKRIERIFTSLGKEAKRETCVAMKGLIAEGDEMIKAKADPAVKDAGLIAAAQRVEHYEMAGYGSARTFAEYLGHSEAATLLQQTLKEEETADDTLTTIAEQSVNTRALRV